LKGRGWGWVVNNCLVTCLINDLSATRDDKGIMSLCQGKPGDIKPE